MITYFKSKTVHVVFIGLLVASVQLMSLSLRFPAFPRFGWRATDLVLSPFQKLFNEVFQTSDFVFRRYVWLQDTSLEREMLAMQIRELESKNANLEEVKNENAQLRNILSFKKAVNQEGLVANVIGRDPSAWLMSITLDIGSNDGVMIGMPVTNGVGVVGRIVAVSTSTSSVLLINDPTSSIGAMLQTSRATGLLEGWLKNDNLKLNYVESLKEDSITKGERVITSGMDGVFPKGLFLGEVSEVREISGELFKEVLVRPAVDLTVLETVLVLPKVPPSPTVEGNEGESKK
jgi:rod shape-determining protein MreC